MVRNKGPWDFKQQGRQYQEFGNYHYGLVGSAAGFPDELLLRAAGWAPMRAGTSADTWQSAPFLDQLQPFMPWPWGRPPYGDDPMDQLLIRMGSSDYARMYGGPQP
jgi:hypothetical protein